VKVCINEKDEEWLDEGEPVSDTRCFWDTVAEDERDDVSDGRLDIENVKVSDWAPDRDGEGVKVITDVWIDDDDCS
jgi:hypothetical protein